MYKFYTKYNKFYNKFYTSSTNYPQVLQRGITWARISLV